MSTANDSIFALLVHKVAPFQFDIGYKVSSASIRDQVVRAQLVVRALKQGGLTNEDSDPLLICGAGVAGLAAAMEAEALGMPFILIEKKIGPAGVLAGTGTRYVSPTMYEWPATSADIHSFPMSAFLPILGTGKAASASPFQYVFTQPALIATFAATIISQATPRLTAWQAAAQADSGDAQYYFLTTIAEESKKALQNTLASDNETKALPPLLLDSATMGVREKRFSAVLFTAGMAPESPMLKWKNDTTGKVHDFNSETPGFWDPDELLLPNFGLGAGAPDASVLVVGGGDGAIQDALRCLVDPAKASSTLAVWEQIASAISAAGLPSLCGPYKWTNVEDVLRHILTLESYTTTGAMWVANGRIYKDLDLQYQRLAEVLIRLYPVVENTITGMLRGDIRRVYLSARGGFSKCYALNRFLIQLFANVLQKGRCKVYFKIVDEIHAFSSISFGKKMAGVVYVGMAPKKFDLIVSRIGSPGVAYQAIGLSGIKPERVEFGRIPVPLMAPPFS
jgi:hypothetical protein